MSVYLDRTSIIAYNFLSSLTLYCSIIFFPFFSLCFFFIPILFPFLFYKQFLNSNFFEDFNFNQQFSNSHNSPPPVVGFTFQQVVSQSNSRLKTNCIKRMMTLNISSNIRTILNIPPPFDDDRFDLQKTRFKIFIEGINYELWKL